MNQLSMLRLFMLMTLTTLIGAWTKNDKVQCLVDAKIVEVSVTITPTERKYEAENSKAAKVKYRPEKAPIGEGFSESKETDENGEIQFLVVESAGTKVQYQAFKPGYISGATASEYVDKGQVSLELNLIKKSKAKLIEDKIRDSINNKSLENAEEMLKEFEKFFPNFRDIEDFKGLKDLELDLKERQKSSSTINPGSLEDLQQMLRAKELERIRTGNPELERGGNGLNH